MTVEMLLLSMLATFVTCLFTGIAYSVREVSKASVVVYKRTNDKGQVIEQYVDPQAKFLTDREKDEVVEIKANCVLEQNPNLPEVLATNTSLESAIGISNSYVSKTFMHSDENVGRLLAMRFMAAVKIKNQKPA